MMGGFEGFEIWEPQEEEEVSAQSNGKPQPEEQEPVDVTSQHKELVDSALKAKDVNRRRIFTVLVGLAGLGIVSSILLNRPQREVKQLQNVQVQEPQTQQPTPTPSTSPAEIEIPSLQIDATTQARDEALGLALLETESLVDNAKNARRAFMLSKSQKELEGNSIPRDITLLREVYRQVQEQQKLLINSGEFSGTAAHQKTLLPLLADSFAVLDALRIIWDVEIPNNNPEIEEQAAMAIEAVCASSEYACPSSYDLIKAMERSGVALRPLPSRPSANNVVQETIRPAELNRHMADMWRLGAVVRRRTHEQKLRELGISDSEAVPPQPSASPKPEEKDNGLPK
ncbi:MAG: hypothetical protein KME06_09650 [Kastovskya adunca ATA6-11-RM4]|jgi:hypothetical protein|nr:hypothetical protein [Kastovskya adunca ATA6-11-RM4]